MGLFDDVFLENHSILPDKPDWVVSTDLFQTKDLECFMGRYKIEDNKLYFLKNSLYWAEEEELEDAKKEEVWEFVDHTGKVNLYHWNRDSKDPGDDWYEVEIIFIYGKIDKIKRIR